ncbi:hypothetical protein Rhopal_005404-T1 [Rhodotorula paludigena]|uniref:F-box domain-containing protein n=1 Tax=Rhodotorula paludigena TaxID=86838 RepID=A0AAV5GT09_9BASI|nr:hypothetical protein Rhopal_005404-T1 [Rhodotorula paludigena]
MGERDCKDVKGSPRGKAGAKDGKAPSPGDCAQEPYILRLPDELLTHIARFYNPAIPFELGHFTLPSRYLQEGRHELRALSVLNKRFLRLLRPILYRTLVFVDDKRRTKTVSFYQSPEVHDFVRELYWQPSYLYNDMSPVFLPCAKNLTYLVLAFLPQDVPDEFVADDYAGLTTLTKSFTNALRQLKNLEALEIPFWESREDKSFNFGKDILPALNHVSIGDWQQWDAFKNVDNVDTVKWLVHPDIDLEEGILKGFLECLGRHAKVLQFAAHSGWGRTDLPETLPSVLREVSWYKDIEKHPLESLTLHGFNPITSHKKEWAQTLPSFLSALQTSNLSHVAFIDVPSLRNPRRHGLDWSSHEPLKSVRTVQLSLATDEDAKAAGGTGEDNDDGDERKDSDHPEMSERIKPDDLRELLTCFPNIVNLSLSNFHRCKPPREHESDNQGDMGASKQEDEVDRFAEDTFQPAARDFVRALGLYEDFDKLQQVVFRSVEAELAVRFRRFADEEGEDGWHEELRRLY